MSVNLTPSRSPSGSPAFSPANRPVYRGGASGSTPYPLSFSALGLTGVDGYVYDGVSSRFWTDNDMTILASSSGSDTVAVVEDLSGNGNHSIQTLTANRPVYYTDGTVKSVMHGQISGIIRYMRPTTNFSDLSEDRTTYVVLKTMTGGGTDALYYALRMRSTGGLQYSALIHAAAWSTGDFRLYNGADAGASANISLGPDTDGAPGVLIGKKNGNALNLKGADTVQFSSLAEGNGTDNQSGAIENCTTFGFYGDGTVLGQCCFLFDVNAVTTAQQDTAIQNLITSRFATWAGN